MNLTTLTSGKVFQKSMVSEELDVSEAMSLIPDTPEDLEELCYAASRVRDFGKGNTVTFSPKVFIPLTRLCRDYCGYCTFRVDPDNADSIFMSPEEVMAVVHRGEEAGCSEALFTLGERPEARFSEAKDWLSRRGYKTTLEYLRDMCRLVMENSSLLPHANPGTMTRKEMEALKPYNASAGLMLESTSELLYKKGGPHEFAPSKRPLVRLKTIRIAGELKVPFTTGLLIGIGETFEDRIEALMEIRDLHHKYGHIQEVIIQNFRAKPATPMGSNPDASVDDLLWTVAAARLILGPHVNIQVPPNLSSDNYRMYLNAGINDWGGVSPVTIDYVNPEAPWPTLRSLRQNTEAEGFNLKPRLAVYPEFFMETSNFFSSVTLDKLESLVDSEGYLKGGINNYVAQE